MKTDDKKVPSRLNVQNRKEIGLELRKTHFQLGNESNHTYIIISINYTYIRYGF